MNKKKNPLKDVKVEVRPAPASLKIILIALILLSMAALLALRMVHNGIRSQTDELRKEAAAVEHANSELEEKLEDMDSVQNVQDIAREELDLVDPDTVILDPQS